MIGEPQQRRSGERREPDPTAVTTDVINREIAHLKEKTEDVIALGLANLETRLSGAVAAQKEQIHRIEQLLLERDLRYTQRFDGVDAVIEETGKAVGVAFVASEKAVASAFESSEKAITKAEVSIEKRADSTYVTLNDLQRQLTNLMPRAEAEQRIAATADALRRVEALSQSVVSRDEYTARHAALQETLTNLASRMDKQEGYSGGANIDRSITALRNQVEANTHTLTSSQGERQGSSDQTKLMIALAGFLLTLLTIGGIVAAIWPNTPGG